MGTFPVEADPGLRLGPGLVCEELPIARWPETVGYRVPDHFAFYVLFQPPVKCAGSRLRFRSRLSGDRQSSLETREGRATCVDRGIVKVLFDAQ